MVLFNFTKTLVTIILKKFFGETITQMNFFYCAFNLRINGVCKANTKTYFTSKSRILVLPWNLIKCFQQGSFAFSLLIWYFVRGINFRKTEMGYLTGGFVSQNVLCLIDNLLNNVFHFYISKINQFCNDGCRQQTKIQIYSALGLRQNWNELCSRAPITFRIKIDIYSEQKYEI